MSKRFLILTQHFPPEVGAAQIRLHAFGKQLQANGHEVRIVTAMPNYPRGEVFPEYRGRWRSTEDLDGLHVTRTWIVPATGRNVLKRLLSYFSFAFSSLPACMREPRPDFIFVESPPLFLGITAYACSRLRRVPFILNVSDLWPASARELGIVRNKTLLWLGERLERFLYKKAYRITAQTNGIRTYIGAIAGADKVMVLYNGVDTSDFKPNASASVPWVAPHEIAFLYAGTLGYAHSWDVILEAAEILRSRPDIVFLLVGDGPEKARMVESASLQGLTNIRFVDRQPVTEMPALFATCRATVVPLRKGELFKSTRPSKIFPALACERPVILSGEGESAQLLVEHRCGIVVPPEDGPAFADAVMRLADHPEEAAEMGRRGRAMVEREYGWDTLVGAWLRQLPGVNEDLVTEQLHADSAQHAATSAISFLIYSPFPKYSGGRENWLSHLSPHLRERGRAIRVIAYATNRAPFHHLVPTGIDLVALPSVRYFYRAFSFLNLATLGLLKYFDLFFLYPVVAAAYLSWKRPVTLVCMNPVPEGVAALLAGVPYVVSVRGDVPKGLSAGPYSFLERPLRWLERLVLHRSRKVLANGRDTRERLSGEGIDSTIVPNGVDIAWFTKPTPAGDIGTEVTQRAAGRPVIAFIATMDEIHGVNDAIDLAVQLKALEPNFMLAMVGKGNATAFRERALALGLAGSIEFMGEAESALDVLQRSSIFLGLSHGNGMSMSALEAMAAGVPIVARDALTYRQLIEDGTSGLLASGPAELADRCMRLLREPETAKRLALAANAAVRDYDWPKVADIFLAELA